MATRAKKKAVAKKKVVAKKKPLAKQKKAAPKKRAAPKAKRDGFEMLVDQARTAAKQKMQRAVDEFGLGSYEAFNLDQTRAVMEFSAGGQVRLKGNALIAGSLGFDSGTWLWSWANESVLPALREPIAKVKELGFEPLVTPSWPAEEADGWSMAAVAAQVLDAQCIYRVPTRTGLTWVLLSGLERVS